MNKDRKIKFDEYSSLAVRRIIEKYIDEKGEVFYKTVWQKTTEPISLGSLAKPQAEIIGFKYTTTKGQDFNIFKGLFG